jgi:hypothetical protein
MSELDRIAKFVAVAEERGFRAGGKRLGVSGPAVSQGLRRLEEQLGVAADRLRARGAWVTVPGGGCLITMEEWPPPLSERVRGGELGE